MITVSSLPNGKYIATYEVVNRPSISKNNAIVYCKFSDDGVTWDEGSLGTRVALSNGRGIGSSPYVKCRCWWTQWYGYYICKMGN